jgi:hypothetical protein
MSAESTFGLHSCPCFNLLWFSCGKRAGRSRRSAAGPARFQLTHGLKRQVRMRVSAPPARISAATQIASITSCSVARWALHEFKQLNFCAYLIKHSPLQACVESPILYACFASPGNASHVAHPLNELARGTWLGVGLISRFGSRLAGRAARPTANEAADQTAAAAAVGLITTRRRFAMVAPNSLTGKTHSLIFLPSLWPKLRKPSASRPFFLPAGTDT